MAYKRAVKIFRTLLNDAGHYQTDQDKTNALADQAAGRAEDNKTSLGRVWEDLMGLIRMMKAWATRRYPRVPVKTIIYVIGAVLYFMSPIDAIPDFIPVIGFLDDAFIIALVMRAIRGDIAAFRQWEEEEELLGLRAAH
jgi:uncharacterized membrane protein YkvA (DUF1232 family)